MGAKKSRFKRSEISVTPWKRLHKGSNCCFREVAICLTLVQNTVRRLLPT